MVVPPSSQAKSQTYSSKSSSSTHPPSWISNAVRQLKLIVPGATITYYLGTIDKLVGVLHYGTGSFRSKMALAALGSAFAMITLFLYVLFLIHRRGEHPDWRAWRQSGSLSTIIPVLTTIIIVGWTLHVIVLGKWTGLGYVQGFVGASSLYALVFGILALIPAPRKRKGT